MRSLLLCLFLSLTALFSLTGCGPTKPASLEASLLPAPQYLVGGGYAFQYTASEAGTAIIYDGNSGTILASKTMVQGDEFNADPDEMNELLNSVLAIPNSDIKPLLYFIPKQEKK